jgi:hypothetical protein
LLFRKQLRGQPISMTDGAIGKGENLHPSVKHPIIRKDPTGA